MSFTRIVDVNDSSQIKRLFYDPENEKLAIRFSSGQTYIYEGIDANVFGKLVSSKSVGKDFAANVRPNFKGVILK